LERPQTARPSRRRKRRVRTGAGKVVVCRYTAAMRFAKLHGLGNDFVLLDLREGGEPLSAERALALCDRHRGIGADGVLTLFPGGRMRVQNADGSVPEMCGNGARCAALWMATEACTKPARAFVDLLTDAGPRPCAVDADEPGHGLVEVTMGIASIGDARRVGKWDAIPVSMGNPHRVIFVAQGAERLAREEGPALCAAENSNVEFVERRGPARYEVHVWERGAGLTQACGTGACAVAAAAVMRNEAPAGQEIIVELPGGALSVRVNADLVVTMRGPAELSFVGQIPAWPRR
jgi:diaminopimelate epimerase